MKFDTIVKEWEQDSVYDVYDIANEIAKTPKIEQKYLGYLMAYRARVKKLDHELSNEKLRLTNYYMGRGEGRVSAIRIVKTEASTYIAAEQSFQTAEEKLEFAKSVVYYLEQVLQRIKGRPYELKTALEWQKFINGGH